MSEILMKRWMTVAVCATLGLAMLGCGLLLPAHLRAVDAKVVQRAGRNTPGLVGLGVQLAKEKKLGPAQLLAQAAQKQELLDREILTTSVAALAKAPAGSPWIIWGAAEPPVNPRLLPELKLAPAGPEPFTQFVIRLENRQKLMEILRASPRALVQELLRSRSLTNTVIFAPSTSSSGQAYDGAVAICGLLAGGEYLSTGLSNAVLTLASEANRGANPQRFEQVLLDLMSLGQRFNWGQLTAFVSPIEDVETLRLLANQVRNAEEDVPVLFSAVQLAGNPAHVARYLMSYSQTGMKDLGSSLWFGAGGVRELIKRNQRLYFPGFRQMDFFPNLCLQMPWLALGLKWLCYLASGFLLATAMHHARPRVPLLEQPLQVRGFHIAREILFGLGFLLVVLLLSEPFLSQESQKVEFPFRLQLPTVGTVVSAVNASQSSIMNQLSLLTLLLFFVLQALLYTACLFKLAEIRRQKVPARMKLKLLENEEHLFDAGLYLGFAGTIISLILVSLGVIKPSLMAAYSSTSFGVVFVSIFKIVHLRPARRNLLLEAETGSAQSTATAATLS